MAPLEARALVNIAGARPDATVVDPMCGTGGLLLEAGLVGADVVGGDAQEKMVRGTRRNLRHVLDGDGHPAPDRYPAAGDWDCFRADAARLPLADGAADAVVFDAPYGRQSRIEGELAPSFPVRSTRPTESPPAACWSPTATGLSWRARPAGPSPTGSNGASIGRWSGTFTFWSDRSSTFSGRLPTVSEW